MLTLDLLAFLQTQSEASISDEPQFLLEEEDASELDRTAVATQSESPGSPGDEEDDANDEEQEAEEDQQKYDYQLDVGDIPLPSRRHRPALSLDVNDHQTAAQQSQQPPPQPQPQPSYDTLKPQPEHPYPRLSPTTSVESLDEDQRRQQTPSPPVPPVAVPLEPYTNQVGGHNHIFRFSRRAICKPLASNENKFYEALEHAHPELLAFVPQYLGVLNVTYRKAGPDAEETATATPTREIFRSKETSDAVGGGGSDQSTEIPEVALEQNQHILPGSDVWDLFSSRGRSGPSGTSASRHMRFMRRSSGLATAGHTPHASPAPSTAPKSCRSECGEPSSSAFATSADAADHNMLSPPPPSAGLPDAPPASPLRPALRSAASDILSRSLEDQANDVSAKTLLSRRASEHFPSSSTASMGTGATKVNRKLCEQVLREVFSNPNLRPQPLWDRGRRLQRRVRMGSGAQLPPRLRQIGESAEGPQSYSPQSDFQRQQQQKHQAERSKLLQQCAPTSTNSEAAAVTDDSPVRKTKSDTSMPSLLHGSGSDEEDRRQPTATVSPAPATTTATLAPSPAIHPQQGATPDGTHVSEDLEKELSMTSSAAERRMLLRHQDKQAELPPLQIPRSPSPSRQEQFLLMVRMQLPSKGRSLIRSLGLTRQVCRRTSLAA